MLCPACGADLVGATIGDTRFDECPACHGTWLDIESFQKLVTDFDRQAAALQRQSGGGERGDRAKNEPVSHVTALPCPRCRRPMNRYEYAGASGVHIDACREHGIWFDRDELRRIIQFIQSGGLEQRRDRHGDTVAPPPPSSSVSTDVWFWWDLLDFVLDIFIPW